MILLNQSTQTTKGRMMLLSLPLILFPFLTLLFWAAGGGKGGEAKAQNTANMGLNLHLPEAQMKNGKVTDKLSFYQRASKDSLRREEEKRYDPFWKENVGVKDSFHLNSLHGNEQKDFAIHYNPLPPSPYSSNNVDANEAKVYQKLARLNSALAQSKNISNETRNTGDDYNSESRTSATDTRKLEAMMRSINESGAKDPELEQLNTMLDKIAAIQHPDDENHSLPSGDSLNNKKTMTVRNKKQSAIVSLLQSKLDKAKQTLNQPIKRAGFYNDASAISAGDTGKTSTFQAIIPQTQIITSGATVQLQLSQDIDVNGTSIGKGSYVFGTASLSNERLQIKINSMQWKNNVYPVSLEVYDMDGLTGVYIPGSIGRETAKQSADRAISGMGLTSLDPSIGAQAASASIEAAKSLIGKKAKLVRVTIPAGYHILLKDSHSN